ncbi:MAG: response regulator [Cyanobacteriota bacterium]|nr:response regulator [Cyanobacteriota bacterium]
MDYQPLEKLLNRLRDCLKAKDWKIANEITFCLFFETVPEDISNPGWIHYQDLHKIKDEVLKESDRLWVFHSQGHFGFSVQWQIYYQLYLELYREGKLRYPMILEETFAEKVGRTINAAYDIKEVNFSLDFPQGYLPWFHWRDSQNYKFRSGIMGGGGKGWEAIFYVAGLLERCGVIPSEGKVLNREEIIEKIEEGNLNFSRGNLVGIDLQGIDLSNANFIGADLSQSNLAKAKLNQTNFHSANLYEANLSEIQGINTCFRQAKLEGTIFRQAQFVNVELTKVSAFRAIFDESKWENVNATEGDFFAANFYWVICKNTSFAKADISYTSWQEAILKDCDFAGLVKNKARLKMTKFVGKNWNDKLDNLTTSNTNTSTTLPIHKYKPIDNTSPTIFIIDDSITVRELLSMTFAKAGYKVVQARDGKDAWELLKVGLICDFILCDIEMPRMDGLELLSRVKKDEKLKDIPFALLSSRGKSRKDTTPCKLDIVARITKPYIEEMLLETVANTLNNLPKKKDETLTEEITNKQSTILIVDDSITARELLTITFTQAGYDVIKAKDGKDALDRLNTRVVCDFILSNIEMSRMDGFQFLARVKQDKKLKNIPFAFISSTNGNRISSSSGNESIVACFSKPFIEKYLLETVANTLNNLPGNQAETLAKKITNKQPTILIVDYSITVRKLLRIAFTKAGYKIVEARDGRDAWEQLQAGLVCDFIFCDTEMPRLDGFELLSRIKKDEKLKNIPLAFLSSKANRRKDISLELGAIAHFTKPFIEKYLLETVANTLNILPESQAETLAEKWINKPPTILIVTNFFDSQRQLSYSFLKAGYKILTANNNTRGWEILQNGLNIDLILFDIEKSSMGGLELLEKIKQDEALHNIPVAIIHAKKMLPFCREQLDIVDDFTKPYIEEKLLQSIAKILGREEEYFSFCENSIEKENINPSNFIQSQSRFFVVGLNLEQRKQLVTLFKFKPNFLCHFFPENQIINPDADEFNAQLLTSQLQERIIQNIGAPSTLNKFYNLSNTYNCTFIPDNLLNYFAEISDNSSSHPVYLVIHIHILKKLDKLNSKETFTQNSTIVIDEQNKIDKIPAEFLKQLQQNWHTKAYITNLENPYTLETFASVINGEAPIEKQITDKESKELDEELKKIFLDFDESQKTIEKEISDEQLIKIFLAFDE